ncbi:MAG TPA: hypothetical protein PK752_14490 [Accumulibacter sp.]|uniref:hypothetical protein n=1 Tax=Accumulibacter sp. TaxID=2053492 RepID=UPI002CC078A7|nr:hypothetical protein [Accumulibacter sp.]HRD89445.1 hypothetical protein [Accumulibacter sp.]
MMNGETMEALGHVMNRPAAQAAAIGGATAQGVVAARTLLLNPLTLLAVGAAGGVVAGFLLYRYRKEIALSVSRVCGMGKDFVLQQKESLADLIEETRERESEAAVPTGETSDTEVPPKAAG